MSLQILRKLLEQQLATITPAMPTQYENGNFTPKAGVAYQQVFLMLGNPSNPEQNGTFFQERGYLQVNLRFPMNAGPGAVDEWTQKIRDAFPFGLSLSANGISVTVVQTPTRSPGQNDGDRYQVPVKIFFIANNN